MDDLTASVLNLLLVSPSILVLVVLIARRVRAFGRDGTLSAPAKLKEAMGREVRFQRCADWAEAPQSCPNR